MTATNVTENKEADLSDPEQLKTYGVVDLKLDKHGLPLVPQPTVNKDDPLVSCLYLKALVDADISRTGHRCSNSS